MGRRNSTGQLLRKIAVRGGIGAAAIYGIVELAGIDEQWLKNAKDWTEKKWSEVFGGDDDKQAGSKVEEAIEQLGLDNADVLASNPAAFIETHILTQMAAQIQAQLPGHEFDLKNFNAEIATEGGKVVYYKKGDLASKGVTEVPAEQKADYVPGFELTYYPNTDQPLKNQEGDIITWRVGLDFSDKEKLKELKELQSEEAKQNWIERKLSGLGNWGSDKYGGMVEYFEENTALNTFGAQLLAGALAASGLNVLTGTFTGGQMQLAKWIGAGVVAYVVLRELEWTKDFIKGLGLEDSATSEGMAKEAEKLWGKIEKLQAKFDEERNRSLERFSSDLLKELDPRSAEYKDLNLLFRNWRDAKKLVAERDKLIDDLGVSLEDFNRLGKDITLEKDKEGIIKLNMTQGKLTALIANSGSFKPILEDLQKTDNNKLYNMLLNIGMCAEMFGDADRVKDLSYELENWLIMQSPDYHKRIVDSKNLLNAKREQLELMSNYADRKAHLLMIEETGRQLGMTKEEIAMHKMQFKRSVHESEMQEAARIPTTRELVEDFFALERMVEGLANKSDPLFVNSGNSTRKYNISTGELNEGEKLTLADFNETQADYLEVRAMLIHLTKYENEVAEYEKLTPNGRKETGLTPPEFEAFNLHGGGRITTAEGAREQINWKLHGFDAGNVKDKDRLTDPRLGLMKIAERRERVLLMIDEGVINKRGLDRGDEKRLWKDMKKGFEQDASIDAHYWREVPVIVNGSTVDINEDGLHLYSIVFNNTMDPRITDQLPGGGTEVEVPNFSNMTLQEVRENMR